MSTAKGRRGIYEAEVEQYLKKRVEESGGMCDLVTKRGGKGFPDCLVTWPRDGWAQLHLIEVKTVGGALDPWQENDHKARRKLNCHVRVIWTKQMVDEYVAEYGARARPADIIAKARTSSLSEFKDYVEGKPCRPGFGGE